MAGSSTNARTFSIHRRELLEDFTNVAAKGDAEEISKLWSEHYASLVGARGVFSVADARYALAELPGNQTFGEQGFLRIWMASKRLLFVQCRNHGRPFQYSGHIFCDSNFISYCEAFHARRDLGPVQNAFREAVKYLLPIANATNAFPYMMENAENPDREKVHAALEAYVAFKLTSPAFFAANGCFDTTRGDQTPSDAAEGFMDVFEDAGFKALYGQVKMYFLMSRIVLLKATLLTFVDRRPSVGDRFHALLMFLHQEVARIPQFESLVAHRFFVLNSAEPFFSPVQANSSKLNRALKSMAWDLAHWRSLFDHLMVFSHPPDKAAFPIPHFLSFDRRFVRLTESFQPNGLIYAAESRRCELIYSKSLLRPVSDLLMDKCHEFYTADALRDRQSRALSDEALMEQLKGIEAKLSGKLEAVLGRSAKAS